MKCPTCKQPVKMVVQIGELAFVGCRNGHNTAVEEVNYIPPSSNRETPGPPRLTCRKVGIYV